MATDYRYDQFNDVLETVERVELHIVPSVSPFVIHLDEVPLRGDPSTVIVREVTGTVEGSRQYGRTFTEVAETPAQDAFRLDYNTGADNDANWNTGAMIFNAADALVMVEVTYQATGTLASIKTNHYPSWWTDRGDGSDGDFYPTEDTTIEGVKNYASVMIPEGVTVSVSPAVLIKCQGAFVNMGTVTADGQGAAGAPRDHGPSEDSSPPALGIAGADGTVSLGGAGGATEKAQAAASAVLLKSEIKQWRCNLVGRRCFMTGTSLTRSGAVAEAAQALRIKEQARAEQAVAAFSFRQAKRITQAPSRQTEQKAKTAQQITTRAAAVAAAVRSSSSRDG